MLRKKAIAAGTLSFRCSSATPVISAKKITWIMFMLAIDATGFSGIQLRIVSIAEYLPTVTSLTTEPSTPSAPLPGRSASATPVPTAAKTREDKR